MTAHFNSFVAGKTNDVNIIDWLQWIAIIFKKISIENSNTDYTYYAVLLLIEDFDKENT